MNWIEVTTQAEVDAATAAGDGVILRGGPFDVWKGGLADVRDGGRADVRDGGLAVVRDGGLADGEGEILRPASATTVRGWLRNCHIPIRNRVVILFKAVDETWKSGCHFDYTPGTIPQAPDWDGGKRECGGGLHFSPRPWMAREFHPEATRYVGCPIRVSDIRPPQKNDQYPQKVKARGCCGPVFPVDEDGKPVGEAA